jgi:hypothetical protein
MVLLRTLLLCLAVSTNGAAEETPVMLRRLQELRQKGGPATLETAWPFLDSEHAAIREAARQAIQAQPFETWKARAIEEKRTWASLEILRAVVESCPRDQKSQLSPHLCEQITTLRIEHMDEPQILAALRLTRLVFEGLGPVSEDERLQMLDLWSGVPLAVATKERQKLIEFLQTVRPRRP